MTPQDFYDEAMKALNQEQWDRATALAVTGLLSFMIGAAKALE